MEKTQYRIANRNGKYYPQVRTKKFLFWSKWKKIAKHIDGFGLYNLPDWKYGKTEIECMLIITQYNTWLKKEKSGKVTYRPFTP